MKGSDVHRRGTFALSAAMAIVGIVLMVEGVVANGGSLVRVLLGVLFVAAGAGRLYLQGRRGEGT